VYLFDLAELEKASSKVDASSGKTKKAMRHLKALSGKCEHPTDGDAANGMAKADNSPPSAKRIRLE
jgi:hypothetical protein